MTDGPTDTQPQLIPTLASIVRVKMGQTMKFITLDILQITGIVAISQYCMTVIQYLTDNGNSVFLGNSIVGTMNSGTAVNTRLPWVLPNTTRLCILPKL